MMPSSMPSVNTGTSIRGKRVRSGARNDFEEIFETLPTGKKVRVAAKCRHCSYILSGHSSAGTGHLLRHQKICFAKTKHVVLVHSRLQYNSDGSIHTWEYKADVACRELCRLIARLDLPLGFGFEDAFD
jgi:hypothetical protein